MCSGSAKPTVSDLAGFPARVGTVLNKDTHGMPQTLAGTGQGADSPEGQFSPRLSLAKTFLATPAPVERPRPAWREDNPRNSGLFDPHLRQHELVGIERRRARLQREEHICSCLNAEWESVWCGGAALTHRASGSTEPTRQRKSRKHFSELLGHPSAACRRQFPLLPGAAKRSGDPRNLSAANSVKHRWAAGVSRSQPPVPGLRVPTPSFRERCFPARCLNTSTNPSSSSGARQAVSQPLVSSASVAPPTVPSPSSRSSISAKCGIADLEKESANCTSVKRTRGSQAPAVREGNSRFLSTDKNEKRTAEAPEENWKQPLGRREARRDTNSNLLNGEEQAKDKTHMEKDMRRTYPLETVQRPSSGLEPSSASPPVEAKRGPLFQQRETARKERRVDGNGKTQPWKRMQQWEEEWKRQKSWREKKLLLTEKKERSEAARPGERAERLWSAASLKQGERDRQSTQSGGGDATAVESHTRAPWGVRTPRPGLLENGPREIQAPAEKNDKDEEQTDPEEGRAARIDRGESETNTRALTEKHKESTRDDRKESQLVDEEHQVINGDAGDVETEEAEDKENSQAFLNGRRRGQNDTEDVITLSLSSAGLVEDNSQKKEERWTHSLSKNTHASAFSSSYIKMALESESAVRHPPAIAASLLAPFQWTEVFRSHLKREDPPPDSPDRHGEMPLSSNREDTEVASSQCSQGSGRSLWPAAGAARMRLPSLVFSEAGPSWGVHTPEKSGRPREASRTRHGSEILRTVQKREKKAEEGRQHSSPSRKARRVKSRGSRARKRERRCSVCSTGVARQDEAADRFIAGFAKKDLKKAAEKAQRLERRLEGLLQFAQCLIEKAPQFLWPGVFEETRILSNCSQKEGNRGEDARAAAASSAAFADSPAGARPLASRSAREERTAGRDGGASGVGSRGATNGEEEKGEGAHGVAEGEDDAENNGSLERKGKDETRLRRNGRNSRDTRAGGRDLLGSGVYVHPGGTVAAADRDTVFESPQHRALSASAQERRETSMQHKCMFGENEEVSEPQEMPQGVTRLTCGLSRTSRTPRIEGDPVSTSLRPQAKTPHSSSLTSSPCLRIRQETEDAPASLHAWPGSTPVPPMAEMGRKSLLAFHGDPPMSSACRNVTDQREEGQTETEADSNSPSSFLSSSSSLLWEAVEQCVVSLEGREPGQYEGLLTEGEAYVRKAAFSGDRADQLTQLHAYSRGEPRGGQPSYVCAEAKTFCDRSPSGRLEPPPLSTSLFEGNIEGRESNKDARSRPWRSDGKSKNERPNKGKREEALTSTSGIPEDTPAQENRRRCTRQAASISGVRTPEFGGADGADAAVGNSGLPETQRRERFAEKEFGKDEKAGAAEAGQPSITTPRLGLPGTSANVSENKTQSRSLIRRDVVSALECESPNCMFIHEVPATEIREIFAFRQKLTAALLSREPLLRRQLRATRKDRDKAEETERRGRETARKGSHASAFSCDSRGEGYDANSDEESRENDLFRMHGSWSIREQLAEELLQELLKEGAVDEIDDLVSQMVKILLNEEESRALALRCC